MNKYVLTRNIFKEGELLEKDSQIELTEDEARQLAFCIKPYVQPVKKVKVIKEKVE